MKEVSSVLVNDIILPRWQHGTKETTWIQETRLWNLGRLK